MANNEGLTNILDYKSQIKKSVSNFSFDVGQQGYKIEIFALLGQSNMVGRDQFSYDSRNYNSTYRFFPTGKSNVVASQNYINQYHNQVQIYQITSGAKISRIERPPFSHIDNRVGQATHSVFYQFIHEYVKRLGDDERRIILVFPYAFGGSGLNPNENVRGHWYTENYGSRSNYLTFKNSYIPAIQHIHSSKNGADMKFGAVLWLQGESDSINIFGLNKHIIDFSYKPRTGYNGYLGPLINAGIIDKNLFDYYYNNIKHLINTIRDTNSFEVVGGGVNGDEVEVVDYTNNVPFIIGELGQRLLYDPLFSNVEYFKVHNAFRRLQEDLSGVFYATSHSINMKADNIHFSSNPNNIPGFDSFLEFGKRYFYEYLRSNNVLEIPNDRIFSSNSVLDFSASVVKTVLNDKSVEPKYKYEVKVSNVTYDLLTDRYGNQIFRNIEFYYKWANKTIQVYRKNSLSSVNAGFVMLDNSVYLTNGAKKLGSSGAGYIDPTPPSISVIRRTGDKDDYGDVIVCEVTAIDTTTQQTMTKYVDVVIDYPAHTFNNLEEVDGVGVGEITGGSFHLINTSRPGFEPDLDSIVLCPEIEATNYKGDALDITYQWVRITYDDNFNEVEYVFENETSQTFSTRQDGLNVGMAIKCVVTARDLVLDMIPAIVAESVPLKLGNTAPIMYSGSIIDDNRIASFTIGAVDDKLYEGGVVNVVGLGNIKAVDYNGDEIEFLVKWQRKVGSGLYADISGYGYNDLLVDYSIVVEDFDEGGEDEVYLRSMIFAVDLNNNFSTIVSNELKVESVPFTVNTDEFGAAMRLGKPVMLGNVVELSGFDISPYYTTGPATVFDTVYKWYKVDGGVGDGGSVGDGVTLVETSRYPWFDIPVDINVYKTGDSIYGVVEITDGFGRVVDFSSNALTIVDTPAVFDVDAFDINVDVAKVVVGSVLTTDPVNAYSIYFGGTGGDGVTKTYKWFVEDLDGNVSLIQGVGGSTYTVTSDIVPGYKISCVIEATDGRTVISMESTNTITVGYTNPFFSVDEFTIRIDNVRGVACSLEKLVSSEISAGSSYESEGITTIITYEWYVVESDVGGVGGVGTLIPDSVGPEFIIPIDNSLIGKYVYCKVIATTNDDFIGAEASLLYSNRIEIVETPNFFGDGNVLQFLSPINNYKNGVLRVNSVNAFDLNNNLLVGSLRWYKYIGDSDVFEDAIQLVGAYNSYEFVVDLSYLDVGDHVEARLSVEDDKGRIQELRTGRLVVSNLPPLFYFVTYTYTQEIDASGQIVSVPVVDTRRQVSAGTQFNLKMMSNTVNLDGTTGGVHIGDVIYLENVIEGEDQDTGDDIDVEYRWYAYTPSTGQTTERNNDTSSYAITAADMDSAIYASVTATTSLGVSRTLYSNSVLLYKADLDAVNKQIKDYLRKNGLSVYARSYKALSSQSLFSAFRSYNQKVNVLG